MATRLIDGGLSTQLEKQGVDLTQYPKTWTAGLLGTAEGQKHLLQAHQQYILAGAQIILTSSYQTSPTTDPRLLAASVDLALLAKETASSPSNVFLSLGPWGATQADGSEYTGQYPVAVTQDFLFQFHSTRLSLLLQHKSVDGLAFETIPSRLELSAILNLIESTTFHLPTWITFSSPDGVHLCDGSNFADAVEACLVQFAAAAQQSTSKKYLGVNCVHPSTVDPFLDIVLPLAQQYAGVLTGIVLYPNNGGTWDAEQRCWCNEDTFKGGGRSAGFSGKAVEWRDRIVNEQLDCFIGGCCSTDADTIAELKKCLCI